MRTYLLPEPTAIEADLQRRLSGSAEPTAVWRRFPSGEDHVNVGSVDEQVCVIGRTAPPGDNLFRTMLLLDTLRRNGARYTTLVLPYFAYARQDRPMQAGDPVTAATITRLLAAAGADRIVTADLHSTRNIESNPIPIESISVIPDMAETLRADLADREFTVVSADYGGQARADRFARSLGRETGAVWIEKDRDENGQVTAKRLVGRLAGTSAVIVDDILDTGGTVGEAVRLLREHGCREFYLCIVHPVFSASALRLVKSIKFRKIVISDTCPIPAGLRRLRQVEVLSAASRLAEAVVK